MGNADVQNVLSYYLPGVALVRIEPLGGAGGWSGSRLWRVAVAAGAVERVVGEQAAARSAASEVLLCLRQFPPESASAERLRYAHQVQRHAVRRGLHFVSFPLSTSEGGTLLEHGGRFWELTTWMPGKADFHDRPSRLRLRAAMQALASFHVESAMDVTTGPAPAINQRLEACQAVMRPYPTGQRSSQAGVECTLEFIRQQIVRAQPETELTPLGYKLLDILPERMAALCGPLSAAAAKPVLLQPAIRDVHHDHVLFTDDEVTGLIDYGALRIDTPLGDVARLLGSLVGDDQPARQLGLDAYAELRPLTDADRLLIDLLDESGTVVAGWNWLMWLYGEERDMGPAAPIARRLEQLLARLESRRSKSIS